MGDLNRYAISDLIAAGQLVVGDGYRAKNNELSSEGIPFARAGNINNGFQFRDADHFPEENLNRVGNKVSQPGDVVFTSKGTVGRFAFVRPETPRFVYSPQLCFWRALDKKRIHPRFLYYWMHSREFFLQFKGVAGQTDMAEYVSLTDQRRMHITLPDVQEQKNIATVLGALDDKRELNELLTATLEAMACTIFKDWFVDFGPTRAKADGLPAYLSSQVWALFPDSFDGKGIPSGWRMGGLQEIVEINPKEPLAGGTVAPYLDMAALPTSGSFPEPPLDREFTSGMRFRNGDTLLARITPCLENGKTAFIQTLPDGVIGWGSTEFIVMRPLPPVPKPYGYIVARDAGFRARAIQSMTGTSGRQRARSEVLAQHSVAIPHASIWQAFGSIVEPIFGQIKASNLENQTLADLRNLLLPKLISGEVRLKGALKTIEDAV